MGEGPGFTTEELSSFTGTVRLRPGAASWRDVMGEVIALDSGSRRYFTMNAAGRLLWEPLAAGATIAELEERLGAAYPEARPRARGDVEAFLRVLLDRGLTDLEAPGSTGTP